LLLRTTTNKYTVDRMWRWVKLRALSTPALQTNEWSGWRSGREQCLYPRTHWWGGRLVSASGSERKERNLPCHESNSNHLTRSLSFYWTSCLDSNVTHETHQQHIVRVYRICSDGCGIQAACWGV
jgi:hypothetical protein